RPDRTLVTAPVPPRIWGYGVPGDLEGEPGHERSYRLANAPQTEQASERRDCTSRSGREHPLRDTARPDLVPIAARLLPCPFPTTRLYVALMATSDRADTLHVPKCVACRPGIPSYPKFPKRKNEKRTLCLQKMK